MSSRRQLVKRLLLLFVSTALVSFAIGWKLLVSPSQAEPAADSADAVVLFAGGRGERLERARDLMDAGVADTLVINRGVDYWNPEAADAIYEICDNPDEEFTVVCLVALPDSTKGEAAAFAKYATENDLVELVYVTTEYHLHRVGVWMNRCFDGELQGVAAGADTRLFNYLRESAALGQTWFLDRSC